jgi:hypothetical protein
MKREKKAPYIQDSGEWPICGWKMDGTKWKKE